MRLAVLLLLSALAVGCGSDNNDAANIEAMVLPNGCPDVLASGEGFETDESATTAPTLAAPDSAWICTYSPRGPSESGEGFRWTRRGVAHEITGTDRTKLVELLPELRVPDFESEDGIPIVCTADLGPRNVVVTVANGLTMGVVFDEFGCGYVRLTDNLATVVPGESKRPGTVRGVLWASAELDNLVLKLAARLR